MGRTSLSTETQTSLSPATLSSSSRGSWGTTMPVGRYSPSSMSMVLPEASFQWNMAKNSHQEVLGHIKWLTHFIWLLWVWRCSSSTLRSSKMTKLLTLILQESPVIPQRKLTSGAVFWLLPTAGDYRWGSEHRSTGKSILEIDNKVIYLQDRQYKYNILITFWLTKTQ